MLGRPRVRPGGSVLRHQVEPPVAMLTQVDVPDVARINFHRLTPSSNHSREAANANPLFPLSDIPVSFQLDDIQTNFVTVRISSASFLLHLMTICHTHLSLRLT